MEQCGKCTCPQICGENTMCAIWDYNDLLDYWKSDICTFFDDADEKTTQYITELYGNCDECEQMIDTAKISN